MKMNIFVVCDALQDPVYGKGKLAEIQGLILGMLDTFNYEQVMWQIWVCAPLLPLKYTRCSCGAAPLSIPISA